MLSWVSFDLPDHCKRTLSALLQAAGDGCSDLHTVPCEGRDVRDDPLVTEQDLRQVLIDMIPIPGQAHAEGGHLMKNLLAEFLRGFSLRTLIFLLDMVLPQLDAYHAGRQLQHLQPWISVELAQQKERSLAQVIRPEMGSPGGPGPTIAFVASHIATCFLGFWLGNHSGVQANLERSLEHIAEAAAEIAFQRCQDLWENSGNGGEWPFDPKK